MSRDMSILTIQVKTKTSMNIVDLAQDLQIDSENIGESFCDQPAKFAWWATVAAQAQTLVDSKKFEVEKQDDYIRKTLVGELDTEVRKEMEINGEKATESKVSSRIYAHPSYKKEVDFLHELKEQLLELQSQAAILNAAKEAMVQRKDSLISLGAYIRTESSNSDLSIKSSLSNKRNMKASVK